MVTTITGLTADEAEKLEFAKARKANVSFDLEDDQLYAITIIKLNNSVVPGDYAQLATDIKAITGVMDIDLLFEHRTRAAIPTDHTQFLSLRADIKLRPPEVPDP